MFNIIMNVDGLESTTCSRCKQTHAHIHSRRVGINVNNLFRECQSQLVELTKQQQQQHQLWMIIKMLYCLVGRSVGNQNVLRALSPCVSVGVKIRMCVCIIMYVFGIFIVYNEFVYLSVCVGCNKI